MKNIPELNKLLDKKEKIIWEEKPALISLLATKFEELFGTIFIFLILIIFINFAGPAIPNLTKGHGTNTIKAAFYVAHIIVFFLALLAIWLVRNMFKANDAYYVITNKRIIVQEKVEKNKWTVKSTDFEQIYDFYIDEKGLIGKIFNINTEHISLSAVETKKITLTENRVNSEETEEDSSIELIGLKNTREVIKIIKTTAKALGVDEDIFWEIE